MDYSVDEDVIDNVFGKIKESIFPSEENNYKSKILQSKILLYCVVFLLVLKVITTFGVIGFQQNIFFADITKITLENFVNQTRQAIGLKPLAENEKLNQAAQLKAQNMVQNNYFEHTSPSGVTPWFWFKQAGYNYKYAGENLAIGFYDSFEVYQAWLNSPSHKANILNKNYTEVGTAVLGGFGGGNTIVVVQEFGSVTPAKTIATAKTKTESDTKKPVQVAVQKTQNTPEVTIKTNEKESQTIQNNPVNVNPNESKVLSESTEIKTYIKLSSGTGIDSIPSKVMSSVIYNHDEWLKNITFSTSLVIIGILLSLILFNINVFFTREIVFRAVIILVLLSITTFMNKEFILSLIPHQIFI